jgi:hypothetical protein
VCFGDVFCFSANFGVDIVMREFLSKLIIVFSAMFLFDIVCMDGTFRGTGEAEVYGIVQQADSYQNLHHNRWYGNRLLQQDVFNVPGLTCQADARQISNLPVVAVFCN